MKNLVRNFDNNFRLHHKCLISGKIIECQDSTLKKGNTRDTLMKNLFVRKDMSEMIEIEGNIVEMTSEKGEMTEIEEMKDKEEGDTKIIDMTNI